MISNGLLECPQTPSARASEGMNSAAERNAISPMESPLMTKRSAAPLPNVSVTRKPASHCAGNCRQSGEADEKVNCWTLWRASRLPIDDQINTGQTQAYGRMNWRVDSVGLTRQATMAPTAPRYHHQ